MSLVQHVSSIYGVDREPELQDEITEQGSALSHMAPIGRNLSYDPLPQPPLPPVEVTAVPPYKVSAARRVGMSGHPIACLSSDGPSSGHHYGISLLARLGNRLRLRGAQAGFDRRRRLPQSMHRRGIARR